MKTLTLTTEHVQKGNLILVNANHPCRFPEKQNTLTLLKRNSAHVRMELQAARTLHALLDEMKESGSIVPVSGYRSSREQEKIYNNSLIENGSEFTQKYVAMPQHSEHQTGYAIDLGVFRPDIDFLCPEFPEDGIAGVFRTYAPRYGFIERYQSGKEHITGIAYEPWHFRYVGNPHAGIMKQNDFSMEEYIDWVKNYTVERPFRQKWNHQQEVNIFHVPVGAGEQRPVSFDERCLYQVSGNNDDGCIVTLWRN